MPDDGTWEANWNVGVIFDSTHFANGTSLEVRFEVMDDQGVWHSASNVAPVVNRAAIFGRYDFEVTGAPGQQGMPTVQRQCQQMNFESSYYYVKDFAWRASWFYNAMLEPINVAYIHSHGASDAYVNNPPTANPPATYMMSDLDENDPYNSEVSEGEYYVCATPDFQVTPGMNILEFRKLAIGSGVPPFNSTGKPPITLAFNDGCLTGNDNAFAEAYLWPYQNAYGGWNENQSQVGWSISKYSEATQSCAQAFWGNLQQGYTVDEARLRAVDAYVKWCLDNGVPRNDTGDPRTTLHVYGDWYTRLHGVYTGQSADSPMTRWVR